jgi:hypothetical protein
VENAKLPRREHENEPIVNDHSNDWPTASVPGTSLAAGNGFYDREPKLFLLWLGTTAIFVALVTPSIGVCRALDGLGHVKRPYQ